MARFRNTAKKRKVDGEDEAEEEIVGEQKPDRQLELDAAEKGNARKVAKKQSREVKKQKSHKAMRAGGDVFKDLLNRPETKK